MRFAFTGCRRFDHESFRFTVRVTFKVTDSAIVTLHLIQRKLLGLYQISAPANLESDHFSEIRPNSASAKYLAGFGRYLCN